MIRPTSIGRDARIPEDTDGDGRADRWSQKDELEGILWIGNDTTGDGQVDFVQGDIWWDGQMDYSAFRTAAGWEQTNLVEAWMEMDFLPALGAPHV